MAPQRSWVHKLIVIDQRKRRKCSICKLELKCGKGKPNTSNMIHHIEHHPTQAKEKKALYLVEQKAAKEKKCESSEIMDQLTMECVVCVPKSNEVSLIHRIILFDS